VRTGTEPEMIFARYVPPEETCVGKKKKDILADADNFCGRMVSAQYAGRKLFLTTEVGGKIMGLWERLIQKLGEEAEEMEVEDGCKSGCKRGSEDEEEEGKDSKQRIEADGSVWTGNRVLSRVASEKEKKASSSRTLSCTVETANLFFEETEKPNPRCLSRRAPESQEDDGDGRVLSCCTQAAPESESQEY
jgi:hypothetical protein